MTTKRGQIAEALKTAFKKISVANGYQTDIYGNVEKRFIFPEDDPNIPLVALSVGAEQIEYQPGGFQDRYLTVSIRAYIEDNDDSILATEKIIQDIEKVVENFNLILSDGSSVRDARITFIDTDQGVLAPLGIAELNLIVEY